MHHPLGYGSGQLVYRDGCRVNSKQKDGTKANETKRWENPGIDTHVGGMCIIDNYSGSL